MSAVLALLAGAALSGPPAVTEVLLPRAKTSSMTAVINLSGLETGERTAARLLAGTLAQGSRTYTLRTILETPGLLYPPRVECGTDTILLEVSFRPEALTQAISIVSSLLTEVNKREEECNIAKRWLEPPSNILGFAWSPVQYKGNCTPDDVDYVWRKVMQPTNLSFAVAGPLTRYDAEAAFRQADWTWPSPPTGRRFLRGTVEFLNSSPTEASAWVLRSPIEATGQALARATLAAWMLGVGKKSTLFRTLREDLAYSYRQECLVIPGSKSWHWGCAVWSTQRTESATIAAQRQALSAAVKQWTAADLERARRQWAGYQDGVFPYLPIASSPEASLGAGSSAESKLAALNQVLLKRPISHSTLMGIAETVTLDDVKQTATNLLETGTVTLLPGTVR